MLQDLGCYFLYGFSNPQTLSGRSCGHSTNSEDTIKWTLHCYYTSRFETCYGPQRFKPSSSFYSKGNHRTRTIITLLSSIAANENLTLYTLHVWVLAHRVLRNTLQRIRAGSAQASYSSEEMYVQPSVQSSELPPFEPTQKISNPD